METCIVIGLGFGDEGKGITTAYLCHQAPHPLVVRFNGGHQAGHTVVTADGRRHVFSSLGSGSLSGAPTYWSRYCTFYPPGFVNEYKALMRLGVSPELYLDALCPVTTCYDVLYNRALERSRNPHGSCGLGFGATIERQEAGCTLWAKDLWDLDLLATKLKAIEQYYNARVKWSGNRQLSELYHDYSFEQIKDQYLGVVQTCTQVAKLVYEKAFLASHKTEKEVSLLFEGAQGVLLDMDSGFFPHVTRSSTTSKNALELLRRHGLPEPEIYYVTRSYQTRHGAGPMTNEHLRLELSHHEKETNVSNEWQGGFRTSVLDRNLLHYALACDARYSQGLPKHLVVTCLDQTKGQIPVTVDGRPGQMTGEELAEALLPNYHSLLLSASDCAQNMKRLANFQPSGWPAPQCPAVGPAG
jgi:adenylosuccinate synthase